MAILECLKTKGINTTHLVSVATDGAPSMTDAQKRFCSFTAKVFGQKAAAFSLHLTSRGTVCLNVFLGMHASNECCHSNYQQNSGKSFKSPLVLIGQGG